MPENHLIRVLADASEQQWPLTTSRRGRDWLITITQPRWHELGGRGTGSVQGTDGRCAASWIPWGSAWASTARAVMPWASGMQCDMAEGRVVYLLVVGQAGRPEQVSTLGDTPIGHVGTVDDQDQQHERWLHSRRAAN